MTFSRATATRLTRASTARRWDKPILLWPHCAQSCARRVNAQLLDAQLDHTSLEMKALRRDADRRAPARELCGAPVLDRAGRDRLGRRQGGVVPEGDVAAAHARLAPLRLPLEAADAQLHVRIALARPVLWQQPVAAYEASEIYTIIEVDTRDRAGLLYDLTRTLADANIYIASSVVATYGEQVVDNFYVKDMFGLKLHSTSKQKYLEKKLRGAITAGRERAAS